MPATALLSLLLTAASAKPPRPESVVQAYLDALKEMEGQRMIEMLTPDAVSEGTNGKAETIDRDRMVTMRGFERGMRTQWSWTLRERHGLDVTVSLREVNAFYEALGVGACHQTVVYSVRDGKISRMATKEISYSGRSYREAYPAFEAWLLSSPAGSDPAIVREGHLLFTGASARALEPWLTSWRERNLGSSR